MDLQTVNKFEFPETDQLYWRDLKKFSDVISKVLHMSCMISLVPEDWKRINVICTFEKMEKKEQIIIVSILAKLWNSWLISLWGFSQ